MIEWAHGVVFSLWLGQSGKTSLLSFEICDAFDEVGRALYTFVVDCTNFRRAGKLVGDAVVNFAIGGLTRVVP